MIQLLHSKATPAAYDGGIGNSRLRTTAMARQARCLNVHNQRPFMIKPQRYTTGWTTNNWVDIETLVLTNGR
jgi:hypothetical protein